MKAVCIRANNYCVEILPNNGRLDLTTTPVQIGAHNIVGMNGSEFIAYDNVTETSSGVEVLKGTSWKLSLWKGDKFTYDGTDWALNTKCISHICPYCPNQIHNAINATNCSGCNAALL